MCRDLNIAEKRPRIKLRHHYTSFENYFNSASSKLIQQYLTTDSQIHTTFSSINPKSYELHYQPRRKQLDLFWTLKSLLGPLVEGLVNMDRLLFLKEYGYGCKLEPVFNENISPRNIAIIGIKPEKN